MRRAAIVLVTALLIIGCGGGEGVDASAVQGAMPSFVQRHAPQFAGLGIPVWEKDDHVLVAVLPSKDVDAEELCDVLARFLRGRHLDDVPLKVVMNIYSSAPIVEGTSADGCDSA